MTGEYLSDEHSELLSSRRGLSPETALALGIVSRDSKIGFRYRKTDGTFVFTKWRGPNKSFFIEPAGVALQFWNLQSLEPLSRPKRTSATSISVTIGSPTIIITEGEFDAAAFVQAGYKYVVSVPNGAPAKRGEGDIDPRYDRQFSYLWDALGLIPELRGETRIILAVDADEPGSVLRDELATRLGPDRCYAVDYPGDCKDASDVLVKHGAEALKDVIAKRFPLVPDKLVCIDDIPVRKRDDIYQSGWSVLDNHLRLVPPELAVVTGTPGSGKSQWTMNWLLNISRVYGVRGAIVALEDDVERIRRDLYNYAQYWKGYVTMHGEVFEPTEWLRQHVLVMPPSESESDKRDLDWLKGTMEEAATRHSCRWFMIDPWNEVEHMFAKGQNETDYLSTAIRDCRRLTRRFNMATVIVAHPDKWAGRNESIDDMTLYSIAGGAVWKNRADHGIVVAREKSDTGTYTGDTIIKIDKVRDQTMMGMPGSVTLAFDPVKRMYLDTGGRSIASSDEGVVLRYDDKGAKE
jgi:twinkle protein